MGMFDTILVPCPECGKKYEAQTKSGDCALGVYELDDAPINAITGVNSLAPFVCDNCCPDTFYVDFKVQVVYAIPRKVRKADKE